MPKLPNRIYLDWNASTPVCSEAKTAFLDALSRFGNPSSQHAEGREAKNLLEESREEIAAFMGCGPSEIIFTSGGTEANNLAVACLAGNANSKTFCAAKIEHPSVLRALERLEKQDWKANWLEVDADGVALPSSAPDSIAFGAIQAANHEVGALQQLGEFSAKFASLGARWHCDAAQAWGRIPLSARDFGFSTATLSGHKLGAPKGVGALFIRRGILAKPLLVGGLQERGFRAGTENLPGAAALAAACRISAANLKERCSATSAAREVLIAELLGKFPTAEVNGPVEASKTLPNTVNIYFPGIDGRILTHALDLEGVAVSSGAACSSGALGPSAVLLALGADEQRAKESIRISFGWSTTRDDLQKLTSALIRVGKRMGSEICE